MYFREIEPGIFLSNEQTIHHLLERCRHCGAVSTMSHNKYSDKCIACGNAYNLYHVRRTARRKCKLTNKAAESHLQLLLELQARRDRGLEAFPDLDEELAETQKIVDNIRALEQREAEMTPRIMVPCICCGDEVPVKFGNNKPVKCPACLSTYARYTDLRQRLTTLSEAEQDELVDIIRHYVTLQRQKHSVPHFGSVVDRLQQIRTAKGLPKIKVYGGSDK